MHRYNPFHKKTHPDFKRLTFSVIIFLVGEIIQTQIGRILLASQEEKNDDDAIHDVYNKAQPPKKFMDHKSFSKTKGLTVLSKLSYSAISN